MHANVLDAEPYTALEVVCEGEEAVLWAAGICLQLCSVADALGPMRSRPDS